MKTTQYLTSLAAVLLGLGTARGQDVPAAPPAGPGNGGLAMPAPAPDVPANGDGNGRSSDERSTPGKSSWLTYARPAACCGPVGAHGPIGSEVYFRSGPSFPFGGFLASQLKPGWVFEGGLRTLFFNPAQDAAWVVDGGISNVNYNSTTRDQAILRNFPLTIQGLNQPIIIPEFPVTPGGLNQTFVNLAVGRECYLWGDASLAEQGPVWRVGWDVGGRWGSSKLGFREIRHRTDVIGGAFLAGHTDVQVPCGCCVLTFGLRAEYGYTWSDILQSQNDADVQAINVLLNFGVRY